jgi:hypothetical protein
MPPRHWSLTTQLLRRDKSVSFREKGRGLWRLRFEFVNGREGTSGRRTVSWRGGGDHVVRSERGVDAIVGLRLAEVDLTIAEVIGVGKVKISGMIIGSVVGGIVRLFSGGLLCGGPRNEGGRARG